MLGEPCTPVIPGEPWAPRHSRRARTSAAALDVRPALGEGRDAGGDLGRGDVDGHGEQQHERDDRDRAHS
jgi:hypothetical protein